jgi:hypothetical protein
MLLVAILVLCIASLLVAVLFRIAVRWVVGDDISYRLAYGTTLLCGIVNVLLNAVVGFFVAGAAPPTALEPSVLLLLLLINFFISAAIIRTYIRISFGDAFLVIIVQNVMIVAIGLLGIGASMFLAMLMRRMPREMSRWSFVVGRLSFVVHDQRPTINDQRLQPHLRGRGRPGSH